MVVKFESFHKVWCHGIRLLLRCISCSLHTSVKDFRHIRIIVPSLSLLTLRPFENKSKLPRPWCQWTSRPISRNCVFQVTSPCVRSKAKISYPGLGTNDTAALIRVILTSILNCQRRRFKSESKMLFPWCQCSTIKKLMLSFPVWNIQIVPYLEKYLKYFISWIARKLTVILSARSFCFRIAPSSELCRFSWNSFRATSWIAALTRASPIILKIVELTNNSNFCYTCLKNLMSGTYVF